MFALPNTCIFVIKYAYPHYQIRIFVPHFVCIFLYADTINRTPTAADGCQLRGEHSAKHSTYTYEMGCEHSARRRGRFIVPVSLHNQIYIFTLSNPYIHFIAHVCPHFKIRIFKSPHTYIRSSFCGCFHICGHDKSAPTAACCLP